MLNTDEASLEAMWIAPPDFAESISVMHTMLSGTQNDKIR